MLNYRWKKTDLKKIKKHNKKVFTCFSGGGGGAFGYELAGYDVVGHLDFNKAHNKIYKANHNPRYTYTMDIRDFNKLNDLPAELYNLDVLDGSVPCFSVSDLQEQRKTWGIPIEKDLHFEFIKLANELQPKVVVAVNVINALKGKSKYYSIKMLKELQNIGYNVQLFRLNAATMGVPQHTQRLFFICHRTDLNLPNLKLEFDEKPIPFSKIKCKDAEPNLSLNKQILWENRQHGDKKISQIRQRLGKQDSYYSSSIIYDNEPLPCITNWCKSHFLFSEPRTLTYKEIKLGASFPIDFDCPDSKILTLCVVPPIMLHQIAGQIYRQWLCDNSERL